MAHAWKACWVKALGGSNPPSSADAKRAHPQGGRVLHLLQCSGFGEEQRRSRCDGVPHPPRLREGGAPRGGAFSHVLTIMATRSVLWGGPVALAAGIEVPDPRP